MTASAVADLAPLRERLSTLGHSHGPGDLAAAMRADGRAVTDESLLATWEALRRESVGAGPLEELLHVDGVTDVVVNGPHHVYLDRGAGLELSTVTFDSEADVRRLAQRLAALVGRRLDDASPYVDARLPDGTRVHAVLAPLADPGTCLSLRVPARRRFTLDEFVTAGSMTAAAADLFRRVIANRVAFLVSGGTGSGKTTLLAALLALLPPDERLVVVEDSRELAPCHPHTVRLEARPPNAEGAGAVTLTELVRQSLRMRPDRVVVGEVRGAEICDLLTALNTGHEGGCGTVHANSAQDVPARLEALAALGGMGRPALHAQLGAALDVVVHLVRDRNGRRRLAEVSVLVRDTDSGWVRAEPGLTFGADGSVGRGPGVARLEELVAR